MVSLVVYSLLQACQQTLCMAGPAILTVTAVLFIGTDHDRLFWRQCPQVPVECLPGLVQSLDDVQLGHRSPYCKHFQQLTPVAAFAAIM